MSKSPKKPWSSTEEALVREKVEECIRNKTKPKWSKIAESLPHRDGKQVRQRYEDFIDPDSLNHGPWLANEDARLLHLKGTCNLGWVEIKEKIPGRGPTQCKNRFNSQRFQHLYYPPKETANASSVTSSSSSSSNLLSPLPLVRQSLRSKSQEISPEASEYSDFQLSSSQFTPDNVNYCIGDTVIVRRNTNTGSNVPGGIGNVVQIHNPGSDSMTYDVKYSVLRTVERNVRPCDLRTMQLNDSEKGTHITSTRSKRSRITPSDGRSPGKERLELVQHSTMLSSFDTLRPYRINDNYPRELLLFKGVDIIPTKQAMMGGYECSFYVVVKTRSNKYIMGNTSTRNLHIIGQEAFEHEEDIIKLAETVDATAAIRIKHYAEANAVAMEKILRSQRIADKAKVFEQGVEQCLNVAATVSTTMETKKETEPETATTATTAAITTTATTAAATKDPMFSNVKNAERNINVNYLKIRHVPFLHKVFVT